MMKTKYLLAALAVPAMFTACTSDELENMNTNTELNGRINLGKVSFVTDNAETRLAIGEGSFNTISFNDGDGMGACLIDALNSTNSPTDAVLNYNLLTDQIQTNYRYTYANNTWTSQANLVEGNYMFYLPYNAEHQSRSAISTNLPTTQTFSKDADGTFTTLPDVLEQSVETGAPMFVGYKFLKAGDSNMTLSLKLQPIYAYPLFTLQNIESTDIEVEYITLKSASPNEFVVKAPFKFASAANKTAHDEANNGTGSFVASFYSTEAMGNVEGTQDGTWFLDKNTEGVSTADLVDEDAEGAKVSSIELMVSEDAPMVIKAGGSVSFHAAIPAGEYTGFTIEVHTTDGKVATMSLNDFSINPRRQYTVESYASEDSYVSDREAALTTIVVGLKADDSKLINSTTELLQAINAFNPTEDNQELRLKINSSDVEITKSVTDILTNKTVSVTGAKIIFTSDVTINNAGELKTKTGSTLSIEFEENITVKGSNNTLNANNFTTKSGKTIAIAEGASATISGDYTTGPKTLNIANNGTLAVGTTELTATKVTNKGTLNLSNNLTAEVVNEGTVNAAATIFGAVTNKGKVVVAKDKTFIAESTFSNEANATITVENKGTFTASTAKFENKAKATVENAGTFTADASGSSNAGTINTTGAVIIDENTGIININSVLASVEVKSADDTTWGNIYQNDTMDGTVTASDTQKQYIWKTIKGGTLDKIPSGSNYNSIVLDGVTLTIDASSTGANAGLIAISFNGGSLTVTGDGSTGTNKLDFTASQVVKFDGSVNVLGKAKAVIQFKENTEMTINKGAVVNFIGENGNDDLTIQGSTAAGMIIKNNGSVTSRATFTQINSSSSAAGTWSGDDWN